MKWNFNFEMGPTLGAKRNFNFETGLALDARWNFNFEMGLTLGVKRNFKFETGLTSGARWNFKFEMGLYRARGQICKKCETQPWWPGLADKSFLLDHDDTRAALGLYQIPDLLAIVI